MAHVLTGVFSHSWRQSHGLASDAFALRIPGREKPAHDREHYAMQTQKPLSPPSAPAPGGGLTLAILNLRASDPHFDRNPGLLALRRALADRIESDIATLDLLGGDPDFEPSLGAPNPFTAGPALDWVYGSGDDREADPSEGPEGDDEREDDPAEWGIADAAGLAEQFAGTAGVARGGFA